MSDSWPDDVFVAVVDVRPGGEIGWGSRFPQQLQNRVDDIRQGLALGSQAVAGGLAAVVSAPGWSLNRVTASFGITLTAEAGVILSKASAGATFDVELEFTRRAEQP